MLGGEGTVEVDLHEADLAALRVEIGHNLLQAVGNAAHCNDNVLGVGCAVVVEEPVIPAGQGVDFCHVVLDDAGHGVIVGVHGLTALESSVGVLDSGAHDGALAVQRTLAEAVEGFLIHHLCQIVKVQHVNLLQLVGGAEAVEEVHKGHAGLDRGQVGNGSHVHALLHAGGGDLGKAGLTAGHHVGLVAEDGEEAGTDGSRRDVDDARKKLSGNAVERRNHQHQALRRSVARRERAALQTAVHGAAGAGLTLHFHQLDGVTEHVLHAVGGPDVYMLRHRAGRRDGINRCDLRKRITRVRGGLIAVHCFLFHKMPISFRHNPEAPSQASRNKRLSVSFPVREQPPTCYYTRFLQ